MGNVDNYQPKLKPIRLWSSFWYGTLILTCSLLLVGFWNISQVSRTLDQTTKPIVSDPHHANPSTQYCHGCVDENVGHRGAFVHEPVAGKGPCCVTRYEKRVSFCSYCTSYHVAEQNLRTRVSTIHHSVVGAAPDLQLSPRRDRSSVSTIRQHPFS